MKPAIMQKNMNHIAIKLQTARVAEGEFKSLRGAVHRVCNAQACWGWRG